MAEKYTCEACGMAFGSKQELDGHVQKEHAQQPTTTATEGSKKKEL